MSEDNFDYPKAAGRGPEETAIHTSTVRGD